jgi:hypothetical protein
MDSPDMPPFGERIYERLATELYKVDRTYWAKLKEMQMPPNAFLGIPLGPSPPRLPVQLRSILKDYATALFYPEANEFPVNLDYMRWLERLASRSAEQVMNSVASIETAGLGISSLKHHGLTMTEMRQAVDESLQDAVSFYLRQLTTAALPQPVEQPEEAPISGPHEQIPEELVRRTIAQQRNIKPVRQKIRSGQVTNVHPTEVERRTKLLADYKAATGNPSNKQLYQARNSGIHKPDFYKWRNGRLPADSSTTINFERFLREKKPLQLAAESDFYHGRRIAFTLGRRTNIRCFARTSTMGEIAPLPLDLFHGSRMTVNECGTRHESGDHQ